MGKGKKSGCLSILIVFILIVAAAIYIYAEFGGISFSDPLVQMVQLSSPSGESVRLEKALRNFFADTSWESIVGPDGNNYVNFRGKAFYGDHIETYLLQFLVGEENNVTFFELTAIEIAGEPEDSAIFGKVLLEKIYQKYH